MNEYFKNLFNELWDKKYTMVRYHGYESVYREKERIDKLDGDIIECGVFRGGMSLFLTKLFPNKKVWLLDSFELGFPDPDTLKYKWNQKDPHIKGNIIYDGCTGVPVEYVKNVFKEYGEGNNSNVNFVEGYVSDTMANLSVEKISVLRIDVDSYSATYEVLETLWDKVVDGGIVIFDDANIDSARDAIEKWFDDNNWKVLYYNGEAPYDLREVGVPCSYIIKGEQITK